MLEAINSFAWVGANVLIAYIAIVLFTFVLGYYAIFDPRATTAGRMIFRFMLSLVGVIGLVVVGIFVDPSHTRDWTTYPGDVAFWRPIVRLIIYGYVAYAITSLSVLLIIRKWKPNLVKKASDMDLVRVRHTGEIPVLPIKKKK